MTQLSFTLLQAERRRGPEGDQDWASWCSGRSGTSSWGLLHETNQSDRR